MLVDAAREHPNRQFIFITPGDETYVLLLLSYKFLIYHNKYRHIPLGTDIKVIRMRPPERGQSLLNFSAVDNN